jgi:hypothetical protein
MFGSMCPSCAREKAAEARARAGKIRAASNPKNPRMTRERVKAIEQRFYDLAEKARLARKTGSLDYESLNEQSSKAFEEMERAQRIYGGHVLSRHNPDSHRISWSDEMVRRLVAAYQGWRRAGMGHREALDRTIKDTTAGKAAIAEFKRRVSRPGFGMNPKACERCGKKQCMCGDPDYERYLRTGSKESFEAYKKKAAKRNPRRRRNPDELGEAADLYREFHGRDPHEILELQESDLARKEYTALGPLVELHTLLPNGAKAKIMFGESDAVMVASSPNGRQIYLLGGNQDISDSLGSMGADVSKDLIDLGDAVFISYDASKWQTDFKPTIWEHKLGEESGIHPRGFYDQLKRRIFFAGGNYRVERPGIID